MSILYVNYTSLIHVWQHLVCFDHNIKTYSSDQMSVPLIEIEKTNGYEYLNGFCVIEGLFWGGCLESIYDLYTSERYLDQRSIYDQYDLIPNKDFFEDKIIFLETSEEKPIPKKVYNDDLLIN
jgi:muramoyltetrapeptide carboxypeptidase LdcA involved in peptidoglycan recycling